MLKFKVHGKWILAGEHSVLRGGSALVFPVSSKYLDVTYNPSDKPFSVDFEPSSNDLHIGFWSVLERGLQKVGRSRGDLLGHMLLKSNIPVGAGMGASATLCVALAKFFTNLGFLKFENEYEFAKSLEDLFHGQSSGVDVAVALSNSPLLFQPKGVMRPFEVRWKPHIYLSFCGRRAVTADCVKKVQNLVEKKPELARDLDQKMKLSVENAIEALETPEGFSQLSKAIGEASQCFEQWDLVSAELSEHMRTLESMGAVAVKPTGSGDGGFVLSLWDSPVEDLQDPLSLIPCF